MYKSVHDYITFNPLLNTGNYVYQKFQEFPKEAFRPDEIPSNSHCCLEGHYIAIKYQELSLMYKVPLIPPILLSAMDRILIVGLIWPHEKSLFNT